ncbi:MAG: CARDB domain-containing protein, partial [Gammaproteobacteria bacterium]
MFSVRNLAKEIGKHTGVNGVKMSFATILVSVFTSCNVMAALPGDFMQLSVDRYDTAAQGYDEALAIVSDSTGNVYVTGSVTNNSLNKDIVTIKYNNQGSRDWEKVYPDNGNSDVGVAIHLDGSGNIYVAGRSVTNLPGRYDNDFVTIKYDTWGNQLWAKRYDNGYDDEPTSIEVDAAGNVYVAGRSGKNSVEFEITAVKYASADGTQLWVKRETGDTVWTRPVAIEVDGNDGYGNVYIGSTQKISSNRNYITRRYDQDPLKLDPSVLNLNWAKTFATNGVLKALALDPTESLIYVTGTNNSDIYTVKYDVTNGQQLWFARYDNGGQDDPIALSVDSTANAYVAGASANGVDNDYVTIRYSASGTEDWVKRYDNVGIDEVTDIALDSTGNVVVTGRSAQDTNSVPDYDIKTFRYDGATGNQLDLLSYDNGGSDQASSVATNSRGNVIVAGKSELGSSAGNNDVTLLRYGYVYPDLKMQSANGPAIAYLDTDITINEEVVNLNDQSSGSYADTTTAFDVGYFLAPGLPTPGLVGLWHLDNDWNDSTSNNLVLTSRSNGTGAVGFTTGKYSLAGNFTSPDANNTGSAYTGSSISFGQTFSVEAWINRKVAGNIASVVAATHGVWNSNDGFSLEFLTSPNIAFKVGGAGTYKYIYGPAIQANTWHHVVATYDNGVMKLYVDGALSASADGASGAPATHTDTSLPLAIGAYPPGGASANLYGFDGQIDEVAVYNIALDLATVQQHLNSRVYTTYPDANNKVSIGGRTVGTVPLVPGATDAASANIHLPDIPTLSTGIHHYYLQADLTGVVTETEETNNFFDAGTITINDAPDLVALSVGDTVMPTASPAGNNIVVNYTVSNPRTPDPGAFNVSFYLRPVPPATGADILLTPVTGTTVNDAELGSSATVTKNATLTIPNATPSNTDYWIVASVDAGSAIAEVHEDNNLVTSVGSINVVEIPDLTISAISAPGGAVLGETFNLSNTVQNLSGVASGSFTVGLYLSADSTITTSDLLIGSRVITSLAGGGSSVDSTAVTIPATLTPGVYYIGAIADSGNTEIETYETNNVLAASQTLSVAFVPVPSDGSDGAV